MNALMNIHHPLQVCIMGKSLNPISNWPQYNRSRINRGSLTFWIDAETMNFEATIVMVVGTSLLVESVLSLLQNINPGASIYYINPGPGLSSRLPFSGENIVDRAHRGVARLLNKICHY
jgi:hypothetical protein